MHEARLVPVGCIIHNKNQKSSLELASLDRKQIVTMKCGTPVSPSSLDAEAEGSAHSTDDRPWNVQQAAEFLGVSPQTVYLWVERQQIPHLRIMGRNIRFLRSDLAHFRATFRQEPEQLSVIPK